MLRLRPIVSALKPIAMLAALSACTALPAEQQAPPQDQPAKTATTTTADTPRKSARDAARNFIDAAKRMEPQIERECLSRSEGRIICDYQFVIDDSPSASPNAFQTRDKYGRPIIGFNLPLIAEARNADEMAFVMAHEGAHHILGHIEKTDRSAAAGGMIFGVLARVAGGPGPLIQGAETLGKTIGARAYSKDYELQADQLGTVIAWNAGYDPERGAIFFTRIPDPGDRFLGSHPANARRMEIVRKTVAALRSGKRL